MPKLVQLFDLIYSHHNYLLSIFDKIRGRIGHDFLNNSSNFFLGI
jgi:hypothetical protein